MNEEFKIFELHDSKYKTKYTPKYERQKKYQVPDINNVYAFIPGAITEVFVKEGVKVEKETRLLVLEAMKMLNRVEAPIEGKIKKVHVKPGDKVVRGDLLVELEPDIC